MSQDSYAIQLPGDAPRSRDLLQAIDADFYNVADAQGMPVASLIVLLDRKRQPVRAELHLHTQMSNEAGSAAVRQAQHILEDRYSGQDTLPMQVWQSFLRSDTIQVPLPPAALIADAPAQRPWWHYAAAVLALLLVVSLIWAFTTGLRQPAADSSAAVALTPTVTTTTAADAQNAADSGVDAAAAPKLPLSINADPTLAIGARVRIRPGYALTLRSEAGSDAGVETGFMTDGQQAVIVDGPVQTRGDSDTIVWWRVRLDDGKEAWAAANTSLVTLLEPVK